MQITVKNRFDNKIIISGEYVSLREAVEKNKANLEGADLWGANLWRANLEGADLWGADLEGAYLEGANLSDIKNYYNSHDIFFELVRRIDDFTNSEWSIIGQIAIHRYCWDDILEKFPKAGSIGKKLAKAGWSEYLDEWQKKDKS